MNNGIKSLCLTHYTSFVSIISTSSGSRPTFCGLRDSGKYLSQNQSLTLGRPFLVQKSFCSCSSRGRRSKSARKNQKSERSSLGANLVGYQFNIVQAGLCP